MPSKHHPVDADPFLYLGPGLDPELLLAVVQAWRNAWSLAARLRLYRRDQAPFWVSLYMAPLERLESGSALPSLRPVSSCVFGLSRLTGTSDR